MRNYAVRATSLHGGPMTRHQPGKAVRRHVMSSWQNHCVGAAAHPHIHPARRPDLPMQSILSRPLPSPKTAFAPLS